MWMDKKKDQRKKPVYFKCFKYVATLHIDSLTVDNTLEKSAIPTTKSFTTMLRQMQRRIRITSSKPAKPWPKNVFAIEWEAKEIIISGSKIDENSFLSHS